MTLARVLRWSAIALAVMAIVDPRMPWPRRTRPPVRLIDGDVRLAAQLRDAGFDLTSDGESASILREDARVVPPLASTPIYVVREHAGDADVSITRVSAPAARVATEAIGVEVAVRARGARGASTTIHLEDGGLAVASATHRWSGDDETWTATLSYLPDGTSARRLRVRADGLAGERDTANNAADLLAPPVRGPVRVLVLESGVTWPTVFVRRALEGTPAFSVSAVQHATTAVATRTGSPPRGVSRRDVAPYEVVLVGHPESLDATGIDALRWFVDERGGVVVFVPDRVPAGRGADLAGGLAFDARTLETPVTLGGMGAGLMTGEIAVPRTLPPLAVALASGAAGEPIVFGMRRGMGAVIVSGALDAWRYRDRNDAAFARFWRAAILQQASAVPPLVEVTAKPSLAQPGDTVRIVARLRGTEIIEEGDRVAIPPAAARVVSRSARSETVVRLWPSAEPGVYEGEWRPAAAGDYAVDASIGSSNGAAVVEVSTDALLPADGSAALSIAAHATGGGVVDDGASLVTALTNRFPARTATMPFRPARSAWFAAAFALLLCGEWALRRRRGFA